MTKIKKYIKHGDLCTLPLVYIHWRDATGLKGWREYDESSEGTTMQCYTVGHLLSEDEDLYRITDTVTDGSMVREPLLIPKKWVKKIKRLKK